MALQNVFGDLALDATVVDAVARLEAIRDRLPAALHADGGLKTHVVNLPADPATETTLAALLTELGQKLEPGGQVALDAATLAALESITVVDGGGSLTVDGPLTNTELRAAVVPVSNDKGTAAANALAARLSDGASYIGSTAQRLHVDDGGSSLSVDDNGGSLTIDGTVTVANPTTNPETGLAKDATLTARLPAALAAGGGLKVEGVAGGVAQPVSGPLTDTQLRASAVPVSMAAQTPDVTDRAARLLGHVTVDNASIPVTDNGGLLSVDDGAGSLTVDAPVGTPVFVRQSDGAAAIDPRMLVDGTTPTQKAAISAAGRLSVDASGVAVPITDNAASLTVDAPVGTPLAARLSDGAAFIDPRDTSDRAAREVGRTRLWDGTDEATIVARGASPASTDKALCVMPLISGRPVYQLVTPERTMPTLTAGALDYLLTLWKAAALAKDVFIIEIGVNIRGVQTAGAFGFELSYISAENGTPGGTTVTPQPLAGSNATASGVTARSAPAAPTLTGQIFQRASFPLPAAATPLVGPGAESLIVFRAREADDAITLRSGQAEGIALRTNVLAAVTTAPIYNAYCRFIERA